MGLGPGGQRWARGPARGARPGLGCARQAHAGRLAGTRLLNPGGWAPALGAGQQGGQRAGAAAHTRTAVAAAAVAGMAVVRAAAAEAGYGLRRTLRGSHPAPILPWAPSGTRLRWLLLPGRPAAGPAPHPRPCPSAVHVLLPLGPRRGNRAPCSLVFFLRCLRVPPPPHAVPTLCQNTLVALSQGSNGCAAGRGSGRGHGPKQGQLAQRVQRGCGDCGRSWRRRVGCGVLLPGRSHALLARGGALPLTVGGAARWQRSSGRALHQLEPRGRRRRLVLDGSGRGRHG